VISHIWNIDLIQIQQCYEKHITLRGGHRPEGEGKRRNLEGGYGCGSSYTRMNIGDPSIVCTYE
jgi:hypothetical protein